MARVTVEDCLDKMPRSCRFELIRYATERARALEGGATSSIEHIESLHKPTVLALREVAEGSLTPASVPDATDLDDVVEE